MPTEEEIRHHFHEKIRNSEEKIEDLRKAEQRYINRSAAFWEEYKDFQFKELRKEVQKNKAKPRKADTIRPKIMCPISGCRGNVTNLVRHLSHCHNYLTKEE